MNYWKETLVENIGIHLALWTTLGQIMFTVSLGILGNIPEHLFMLFLGSELKVIFKTTLHLILMENMGCCLEAVLQVVKKMLSLQETGSVIIFTIL